MSGAASPERRQHVMSMPDDLFAEAQRQLNICNSCRYCEGYCAVFPALERRTVLEIGDITQLASLCHDCRACYHACMYAPPHEFAVDPPTVLTAVRLASYRHYLPPAAWPRPGWWPRRNARAAAAVLVVVALLALVATTEGIGALLRHGSPYQVIPLPGPARNCAAADRMERGSHGARARRVLA